jgi:hypothetical protein
VFGPSILFVALYAVAWKVGMVEAWTVRMVVWGMR